MSERKGLDRELAIDTMASWALEGLEPDQQTIDDINQLLNGSITEQEFRRRTELGPQHDR